MQKGKQEIEPNIIKGCERGSLKHQEMLYRKFYAYGMSITLRYTKSKEEAIEVLNDSFLKVFENIKKFDKKKSFKSWFRQITINTSIDYYRKNKKTIYAESYDTFETTIFRTKNINNLDAEDILKLLDSIPEHLAIIFNLYEIEGYNHYEIAKKLGISDSTSRANLSRAKKMLRELFKKHYNTKYAGAI